MPEVVLPITAGFYESDSLPLSAQECVNLYPVISEVPTLSQEALFGTPGLDQIATSGGLTTDLNRGAHRLGDTPFFVNGANLYRLNADYSLTTIGAIAGTTRVSMADNGTQILILVPGGTGYIYSVAGGLVTITDGDFTANGAPQYVVFIDGYFCCSTDSKKFIVSALNDGTSWDALDFGTAEADPDDIVAPVVYNNQLFIAGSITTEQFSNQGGADFPFQRTGLFLDKGVFAPFSIINTQSSFMFIGGGENESPAVWQLAGNSTQKVSTIPIERLLATYTEAEISAVFALSYSEDGAYFVEFVLPDTAIVFDTVSNRWHERKSRVLDVASGSYSLTRHRVNSIIKAYGVVIAADYKDGRIGILDRDAYTEYTIEIFRRAAGQPFQNNMKPFFLPSLELTMESGTGNTACDDPIISLEQSDDGKVWTDPIWRRIGKKGEFGKRQIWRRLGRVPRTRVFRFTVTDCVKVVMIQLTVDMVGG